MREFAFPPVKPGTWVYFRQQRVLCGRKTCAICGDKGPGHGPYWYMYWRGETGRYHSGYIGKTLPASVEEL